MSEKWHDTTAVLLAGGRSRRMGRPKHLLTVDGLPFWQHTLAALSDFDRVAVSVGAEKPEFAGLTQWVDETPGFGPVGAMAAAYRRAETELVQLVTCDAPFVEPALFGALREALEEGDDAVVPSDGERNAPLLGLYRTAALRAAEEAMHGGEHRVRAALEGLAVRELALPEELRGCLRNVNTPEEYRAALGGRGESL